MIENTLENKAKFFAQYWGQKVVKLEVGKGIIGAYTIGYDNQFTSLCEKLGFKNAFLELTHVHNIRDEDLTVAAELFGWIASEGYNFKRQIIENFCVEVDRFSTRELLPVLQSIHIGDFLRSKGYALDYLGTPVSTLIEYGWVKLKEVTK